MTTDPEDEALRAAAPGLWAALSPFGRGLRLPADFLPGQTAEARGVAYNATIGEITDGRGGAVPIPAMAAALGGLPAPARSRALLYSPVEGLPDLRARWRELQRRGRPEAVPSSLPLVAAGLPLALAVAAELFCGPGRAVVLSEGLDPDLFALRTGALSRPVRLLRDGRFDPAALAGTLAALPPAESAAVVLRLPGEPGGPVPGAAERAALIDTLAGEARRRPLAVLLDDRFEGNLPDGSLFWDLAGRDERLVSVKADGPERAFGGGRVAFLTFPYPPGSAAAKALEDRAKTLLRAVSGSPPAMTQVVLLQALGKV